MIKRLVQSPLTGIILILIISLAISLQKYFGESFNNYQIFIHSYDLMIQGLNIYYSHPDRYHDLFKYSPTFAAFMAPFWWMPILPGLFLWNAINAFCLYFGIKKLFLTQSVTVKFPYTILRTKNEQKFPMSVKKNLLTLRI